MRKILIGAIAAGMVASPSPAFACPAVQFQGTVHVISDERPEASAIPEELSLFRVRYEGERIGREDRLWPNFFVLEILEGPGAGGEALVPAHITSCDSVFMRTGQEGWVVGILSMADDRIEDDRPVLASRITDRRVKSWPVEATEPQ